MLLRKFWMFRQKSDLSGDGWEQLNWSDGGSFTFRKLILLLNNNQQKACSALFQTAEFTCQLFKIRETFHVSVLLKQTSSGQSQND